MSPPTLPYFNYSETRFSTSPPEWSWGGGIRLRAGLAPEPPARWWSTACVARLAEQPAEQRNGAIRSHTLAVRRSSGEMLTVRRCSADGTTGPVSGPLAVVGDGEYQQDAVDHLEDDLVGEPRNSRSPNEGRSVEGRDPQSEDPLLRQALDRAAGGTKEVGAES